MNNVQRLEEAFEEATNHQMGLLVSIKRRMFSEGREMNAMETEQLQTSLRRAEAAKEQLERAKGQDSFTSEMTRLTDGMSEWPVTGNSVGSQFVNSAAGKWLQQNKHRGAHWETPVIEIHATTLTEGTGSGGKLVVADYRPGIVPVPIALPTVADLLSTGPTNSNAVVYFKETSFTNAAAAVAEAAAKPESTLVFDQVTDPVQKLAHWLPVTDEILEDVPALRAYIDARLIFGVQLTEDDQLLNGDGVSPNLKGLMNRTGLAADVARGTATNADAIAAQIAAIATTTNLRPTGVVVHPTNWNTIALAKDTTGNYIAGGGPFVAPGPPTLWGLPVSVTSKMVLGTALVVTRTSAMVFRRGPINVQASNSHQDFFTKNMVAIRGEERIALAVMIPASFGKVTGLN